MAPDRELTRLFLRRFIENDLISPDADRAQVLSQACAAIVVGGLFVTTLLSLGHLNGPYPRPSHTALQVFRIELLYAAWSMTVMALVAVSVWDALSLDSRDAQILGPLPVRRGVILRAKVAALVVFSAAFAAALNLAPGLIHPVFALSRLKPTLVQVATLIAAQLTSTTAAAAFGFFVVLGLRELLYAILRPAWFRRISLIVQGGLVVALVTTLLLIPALTLKVAEHWLTHGGVQTSSLPPLWFVGLHDMMSGHIWAQVPRPDLPAHVVVAERTLEALYQSRRPLLHQLGAAGAGSFVIVLLGSAAAYFWNNRRLPDPPSPGTTNHGRASGIFDAIARRLVARRPLVRAGFFFTVRVLGRSAQNRLSIAIPLAIAVAVAVVSLPLAGLGTSLDFSSVPIALLAVQMLFVSALVIGFRHSVRVPADLRARWLFHLVQAGQAVRVPGGRQEGGGRQAGPARADRATALVRRRVRPADRHPALRIRPAQRVRALRGGPAGISPAALCVQLRSDHGRVDERWRVRVDLPGWRVHGRLARARGAEHHARDGRALCRDGGDVGTLAWSRHLAPARPC